MFARTGGGRDDARPPDFKNFLMVGLPGGGTSANAKSGDCFPFEVSLKIKTTCPDGKDNLEISYIAHFEKSKIKEPIIATHFSGEHEYYTTKLSHEVTRYLTYIPEIGGSGAITVLQDADQEEGHQADGESQENVFHRLDLDESRLRLV